MHKKQTHNVAQWGLWGAYLLALLASLTHVAWAFETLEFDRTRPVAWLAAFAVDAGLAALAYSIQQRKARKLPTVRLWVGVAFFAAISAAANLWHACAVVLGVGGLEVTLSALGAIDPLQLGQAVALSASLPLLVLYLGDTVSTDEAQLAKDAQKALAKVERARHSAALAEAYERGRSETLAQQKASAGKDAAGELILAYCAQHPRSTHADLAGMLALTGNRLSRQTVGKRLAQAEQAGIIVRNGNGIELANPGLVPQWAADKVQELSQ